AFAVAQDGPQPQAAAASTPTDPLSELVKKQFGDGFTIVHENPMVGVKGAVLSTGDGPWRPLLTGDLDGDGVEDAVIIARSKNALMEAAAYAYRVVDPYFGYYENGDPNITIDINAHDPMHNMHLLVIHGSGAEAWRAEK